MDTKENTYVVHSNTMGNQVNYNTNHYTYIPDKIPVLLGDKGKLPVYKTKGSAGADLSANNTTILVPRGYGMIGTGISISLPHNTVGLVFARSGLASKGLTLANGVGVIDSDYRGEIKLCMYNMNEYPFEIQAGDRVGQIVVVPVHQFNWLAVTSLDSTERGTGGFGSTGV